MLPVIKTELHICRLHLEEPAAESAFGLNFKVVISKDKTCSPYGVWKCIRKDL